MGMEEKKPAEITENSSDQAKNKAESNPDKKVILSFF